MSTATVELIRVERVDDLPVLWACLQRLKVAEFLDRHFPTHHLWLRQLSLGEVVSVWLLFPLSQGEPDFPDIPLGGWAGTIREVGQRSNPPMYLIEWGRHTRSTASGANGTDSNSKGCGWAKKTSNQTRASLPSSSSRRRSSPARSIPQARQPLGLVGL
jgi:hypothetical protein